MSAIKLTEEQIKEAQELLLKGITPLELAEKYGVTKSQIYRRVKDPLCAKKIPVEIKKNVIDAIEKGYTKSEAAQMYGLNIGTVYVMTQGLKGYRCQGNHILRKNGIILLNRLMADGYLISDFVVSTVREIQKKFPIIRTARYRDKTFFYLPGREEETIEAFFREKPDRIISYSAIEEMSYLLGVKISDKSRVKLLERYKSKHVQYWESRRLIQRSLDDWVDDNPFLENAEPGFRLFPKQ